LVKLLFLCTGNICRSPTAQGICLARIRDGGLSGQIHVDSAGIHGYHRGDPPDPRSIAAARRFGVDLTALRARKVTVGDLDEFDIIAVMERNHLRQLAALRAAPPKAQIRLLMEFAGQNQEVPDPYYDDNSFDRVYRMIEQGVDALLNDVKQRWKLP
jgi:protein-tyrosine phosphatase